MSKKLGRLTLIRHFHPSLIFMDKPRRFVLRCALALLVISSLGLKYLIVTKWLAYYTTKVNVY